MLGLFQTTAGLAGHAYRLFHDHKRVWVWSGHGMVVSIGMLPRIHSNDGFTQLEEVWLGDVYPHEFYDHLEPDVKDVFYRITDMTKQDLDHIQRALESMGVTVQRPRYGSIDDHLDHRGVLRKPEITPRDHYLVVGQDLLLNSRLEQASEHRVWPWAHAVDAYRTDADSRIRYHYLPVHVSGANTVRVGRDLFVDCVYAKQQDDRDLRSIFAAEVESFFPDRRCHYLDNGGHIDGCFALLRPGLILANRYFQDYDRTFPAWQVILRDKPEFQTGHRRSGPWSNGKWWLPDGLGNRAFNDHVIRHAQDWIGDYTETFFEVNCLVVNPENVLMLGTNPTLYQYLKDLGITAHELPFRCRTFWDGGLHCLTLDIRRQGGVIDYFANLS